MPKDIKIKKLKGKDRVRLRPGVIFGSNDGKGCAHGVFEIISNSVDEARSGYGNEIIVTKYEDNSFSVEDFGRGAPVEWNKDEEEYDWFMIFADLYAGGKMDDDSDEDTLGLNGLGLASTQYASKWMNVRIRRSNGYEYTLKFEQGDNVMPEPGFTKKKTKEPTGTYIHWLPDLDVFTEIEVPLDYLRELMRKQAIVNAGVKLVLKVQNGDSFDTEEFYYPDGITGYVKEMATEALNPVQYFSEEARGKDREDKPEYTLKINFAFCFTRDIGVQEYYHNSSFLEYGGAPAKAVEKAFIAELDKYIKEQGKYLKNESKPKFEDIKDSLIFVSACFQKPASSVSYENQTKKSINNKFVQDEMVRFIRACLSKYFAENKVDADAIMNQVLINKRSREKAAESRIEIKKKLTGTMNAVSRPAKFVDCRSKDPDKRELYIVEGDSAAGSVKSARNAEFQALMPIRGKILSCLKVDLPRIFKSEIITDLIKLFGCGVEVKTSSKDIPQFDISKLRYNKIIFCCFTGDTRIKALDGKSYSFKELVDSGREELYVYSMNKEGRVVPGKATNIRITGMTDKLVHICLDNGETIKCTPDHMFMLANGQYMRADELKKGFSLMPLYTKINEFGYEEFFDKVSGEWEKTHRMVAETVFAEERTATQERFQNEEHLDNQHSIGVHHIDLDKLNNDPSNLIWLTAKEHFQEHGKLGWTPYNISEKHRKRVSQLWAEGHYEAATFTNRGYNGSDEQKEKLKKAWERGAYKDRRNNLIDFNKSERHRNTVIEMNKTQEHIDVVNRSHILKSIKYLQLCGLPFDDYHYNFYRLQPAAKYESIYKYFESYEDAWNRAISVHIDLDTYRPCFGFIEYDNQKKQRTTIAKEIHRIIESGQPVSKETYQSGHGIPKWESITKYYESIDNAIEAGRLYNHTITDVWIENVESEPVYCMTVEDHHNFLLDSGVFVKNCDQDVDGYQIRALLLAMIYRLCPTLIKEGKIYIAESPLYEVTQKDKTYFAYSDADRDKILKKIGMRGTTIQRSKGLGENDADMMALTTMNPATRRLIQITPSAAEEAEYYYNMLLGNDLQGRKDFIAEHGAEYLNYEDI